MITRRHIRTPHLKIDVVANGYECNIHVSERRNFCQPEKVHFNIAVGLPQYKPVGATKKHHSSFGDWTNGKFFPFR